MEKAARRPERWGKMNRNQQITKQSYLDAQRTFENAKHRAIWIKNRMYNAQTEEEFDAYLLRLNQQEQIIDEMAINVMSARYAFNSQNAGPFLQTVGV